MSVRRVVLIRNVADEFELVSAQVATNLRVKKVQEVVDHYVFVHDIEGLDRLVTQIHIVQDHAVLEALRRKGFFKEIEALCDKAGSMTVSDGLTAKKVS